MDAKNMFDIPTSIPPEKLKDALQQAIELEIATIPLYLYTYYSIKASFSQEPDSNGNPSGAAQLRAQLKADLLANGHDLTDEAIHKMSVGIQVYAGKAAGLIMSVVIEEMLHMSLTSNVKQAIFGPPQLYNASPNFPVNMPGHEPALPLHLAKLSKKQLISLLRVESPKPYNLAKLETDNAVKFTTIGEFYGMIEQCVVDHKPGPYQNDRPQLVPGKGYYGPNSIDTVHYDEDHNPQFPSEDDSGNLIHVTDMASALRAMAEVVEQGEGHTGGSSLDENGNPNCTGIVGDTVPDGDYDDPSKKELSHFAKFLELYCKGKEHTQAFNKLGLDFESYFVLDLPEDPKNALNYTGTANAEILAASNLINGLFSYLFLMAETCYYQRTNVQYEVFMMGIHKGMIWALSTACNAIVNMKYTKTDGSQQNAAPTFEFWDFGATPDKTPKQQLGELVAAAGSNFAYIGEYVEDFPDVGLDHSVAGNPMFTEVYVGKKSS